MPATVRELWQGNAARLQHGVCEDCGEGHTVARQERAHKFQCLACFTTRPTGNAVLRKLVRRARRAERQATSAGSTPAADAHELRKRRLEGKAA